MIDPDTTPAERFDAWLAEQEAAPPPEPLSRRERRRRDAEAFLALAGVVGISAMIVWWRKRNSN